MNIIDHQVKEDLIAVQMKNAIEKLGSFFEELY